MAVRSITYVNDPLLRQKSKKVTNFNPALQTLAEDLVDTMREKDGLGLAAPQIGVLQRLIAIEVLEDKDDPQSSRLYVVVNPEIVKSEGEEVEGSEGCISIPNWFGLVKRASRITVKGQDVKGKALRVKANGPLARVFQHEIDHLNGVLFIDRVEGKDKIWYVDPNRRAEKEKEREAETGDSGQTAAEEPVSEPVG